MPRNSSGVYQLPAGNPVAPGTLIESVWANSTMSDLAQAMTDSLDRFGRSTMAAPMLLNDGTVAAPGLAFGAESSTGLFRESSHILGISVAGTEVARFAQNAIGFLLPIAGTLALQGALTVGTDLTVTGTTTATGKVTLADTLTLADDKAILWGDGSTSLKGNSTTDILVMAGKVFDSAGSVRGRGAPLPDITSTSTQIGTNGFTTPLMRMIKSDGAANAKIWDIDVGANSEWFLNTIDDAMATVATAIKLTRSGLTPSAMTISPPLGVGIDPGAGFELDVRGVGVSVARWSSTANAGIEGTLGTVADNAWVNANGGALTLRTAGAEKARLTPAAQPEFFMGQSTSSSSAAGRGLFAMNGTVESLFVMSGAGTPRGYLLANATGLTVESEGALILATGSEKARITASADAQVLVGLASPYSAATGRGIINLNGASSADISIGTAGVERAWWFADNTRSEFGANGVRLTFFVGGERASIETDGTFKYQANEIGWRGMPLNIVNGFYNCTASDKGKCVIQIGAAGVGFNGNTFAEGDVVTVMNRNAGAIGIATTGITISWGTGTPVTGARTLASNGVATFIFVGLNSCVLTGSGLS